jgi:general secretion pathway protein A
MYARHFGLAQPPFSIAPDPRYLYLSERHREALAHLLYGVRSGGGGFVVLTGEVGTGKTTVCRCLLEQLPARCNVAYIFNPRLTVEELLQSICAEFRIPVRGAASNRDHVDALNEYLLRMHAVQHNNVLIIDEAQALSAEVLEQLRLLTNLETRERKLLQIVLIGQPELRTLLARPDMSQLAQRVIARYHLGALDAADTGHYVRHRLAVAGLAGESPFDAGALRLIHRLSGGVPRRINLLCDRALLGAYAQGRRQVDERLLQAAAREVFDAADVARSRGRRAAPLAAALAAAALLAGAVAYGLHAPAPAPTAAVAATAPAEPAPADTAPAAAPPEIATFDLATGFASLVEPEREAWRALARAWGFAPSGDPCREAALHQLRCFRGSGVTLTTIRLLDRPGLLTLRDGAGRTAHVVLTGLSAESATLAIDGVPHRVPIAALADYWRGDFATLWRTPNDGRGSGSAPDARWLAQQLAVARGDPKPAQARADAATLRASIHAFQLQQGLPSDGIAGPMTLMQLNRALGVDEPRLHGDS